MACPDRDNDARIVAEIERRKAMTSGDLMAASSGYEEYLHEGSLLELHTLGLNEIDIVKIQQVEKGSWKIIVKSQSHDVNQIT